MITMERLIIMGIQVPDQAQREGTIKSLFQSFFPGYYGMTPYDYYGEAYYNGYTSSRPQRRPTSKKGNYEKEGRINSKGGNNKEEKKDNTDKDKLYNNEFPPLNGKFEKQDTKGSKPVNGKGVWDNPPLWRDKERHDGLQLYRSLLPNKSTHASPTPPMDILNTRFVTTPKTLGDKKSQFLKTLRKENASKAEDGEKNPPEKQEKVPENKPGENQLVQRTYDFEQANDSRVLSFSVEAELRLLREMGWKESDDEEYEITEDDIKQFQNRLKQAQQQRNGLVHTLPKTWRPKHIPVYQADMQELNEPLSSDSDSDDLL